MRRRAVGCTVLHMTFPTYLNNVRHAHMRIFGPPIDFDEYDISLFRKAWSDGLSPSDAVVLLCDSRSETFEDSLIALYDS